jgi:molybdopterin-guanine dinucleotide biosynthesis protein A
MYNDITGIILSGGKSLRMGENKSLLKFGDKTAISITVNLMKSLFNNVILITNEPELYQNFEIQIFEDIYKGFGPISGIHSGLLNSTTENNFILSCDMPLMNNKMIQSIIEYPSENLIKVPKADGFIQQLCGKYSKLLIPEIEIIIKSSDDQENRNSNQKHRKCKVHKLIDSVKSTVIENTDLLKGYSKNIFLNMNRPEDYKYIQNILMKN